MPSFVVPALPRVIPQDSNTAGWYAAAALISLWRRQRLVSANDNRAQEALKHRADSDLPPDAIRRIAATMGLAPLPPTPVLPGPVMLEQWLRRHGPIWTDAVALDSNGALAESGHVVVIGGVDTAPAAPRLYILDPSPAGRGHEGWRPFSQLHARLAFRNGARGAATFLAHG